MLISIKNLFKIIILLNLLCFSYLKAEDVPVIVIAPNDRYYEKTLSNTQEVIARGGKIFFITDNKKRLLSTNIRFRLRVPRVDNLLSPLLLTIPLQLLAYHVALLKNCDIDKPRNLAKSVTVE